MKSAATECYIIRAAIALCSLASLSQDHGIRDDMQDEVAILIRLWIGGAQSEDLRRWCTTIVARLEILEASAAHVAVLRLQSSLVSGVLSAPLPAVRANKHHAMVLEFIGEHPGIRTNEVVARFMNTLSARTTKRFLGELVALGRITREKNGNMVSYSLTA